MALTLTHPTAGPGNTPLVLDLPEQLSWPDEFTWAQVVQSAEYTTTGALVLDAYAQQAGRPITLAGSETRAWCERGALLMLRTWASQPGLVLTLSGLRGTTRSVTWNHDGGALSAEPIHDWADPADTDPYAITLKFLEL
jgi:hypothetical protein